MPQNELPTLALILGRMALHSTGEVDVVHMPALEAVRRRMYGLTRAFMGARTENIRRGTLKASVSRRSSGSTSMSMM